MSTDDVNKDGVRRLEALRRRTRDPEVIWACDFGIAKVQQLSALISASLAEIVPERERPVPKARKKAEAFPGGSLAIEVPDAVRPEAREAIEAAADRKAYMREYMRKRRAEKKGEKP